MIVGHSKLGGLLFKSALIVGTAVLVAKNEKVRRHVTDTTDAVTRFLTEFYEKFTGPKRGKDQAPAPPAGTPEA
ncbi:MAG: hypothetical protein AB1714_13355 [Acidobacteriota bacterium]